MPATRAKVQPNMCATFSAELADFWWWLGGGPICAEALTAADGGDSQRFDVAWIPLGPHESHARGGVAIYRRVPASDHLCWLKELAS